MDKIFYIGKSQGASAMLQALADKDLNQDLASSLHKVIGLSPCDYYRTTGLYESYFINGLYKFPEHGITSILGPNWDQDLKKICKQFS